MTLYRRVILCPHPAVLLLVLLVGGCVSPRAVRQEVSLTIDLENDVVPATDAIVHLYPVWGNQNDRIEVGVVRGASKVSFRVTVPAERYVLGAVPLFRPSGYVAPLPNADPVPFGRSERFTLTPETRRLRWVLQRSDVTLQQDGGRSGT